MLEDHYAHYVALSEEEFDTQYPLIINNISDNASWQDEDGLGRMFETYGEELEFVRKAHPRAVWTVMDGDNDDIVVVSGFHYVNRIGYLISSELFPENTHISVTIAREGD
jgi:hypothetical protein